MINSRTFNRYGRRYRSILTEQYYDFYVLNGIFFVDCYDINFETDYTWYKL